MSRWGASLCASATVRDLGELIITGESGDDLSMHIDGCWNLLDPTIFWAPFGAQAFRGENVVISSLPGRYEEPWRLDQSTYDAQIMIDGDNDWLGDPYGNPFEGLELNLEHLVDELVIPPVDINTKSRPSTLEMPSGAFRSAQVQPRGVQHQITDLGVMRVTLTIVVPLGRFVTSS